MNKIVIRSFITTSVCEVIFAIAVSSVFDLGFWEAFLWLTAIRVALWVAKAVREIACMLVNGTADDEYAATVCKILKEDEFPMPELSHRSTVDYFEAVRLNSDLDPEVRLKAAMFGERLDSDAGALTFPAILLCGKYCHSHLEVIRRELA